MSLAAENNAGGGAFSPAIAIGVAMAAFVGFLVFVGLGAYEGELRTNDGGAHALSKSAVGFSGVVDLLNATGRPTVVARGDLGWENYGEGLMVLTLPWNGDPKTPLGDLSTTREFSGPVLAVLPKWMTQRTHGRGWVRNLGPASFDVDTWIGPPDAEGEDGADEDEAEISLARARGAASHTLYFLEEARRGETLRTGPIENLQTLDKAPGWTPLIVDEGGRMVLGYADDSSFYVLSDPDLINNHGIAELASARTGLAILEEAALDGPIFFDVTLVGLERSRNAIKLMIEPPFLPATLCVIAAAFLMMWHGVFRFGAPQAGGARAFALGKEALADNQAGLIRMARREPAMAPRYVQVIRNIVSRAVGAPRDLSTEQTDALLDRLAEGRATERISALRDQADQVKDKTELMNAAERLHRWRLEMTRERK